MSFAEYIKTNCISEVNKGTCHCVLLLFILHRSKRYFLGYT